MVMLSSKRNKRFLVYTAAIVAIVFVTLLVWISSYSTKLKSMATDEAISKLRYVSEQNVDTIQMDVESKLNVLRSAADLIEENGLYDAATLIKQLNSLIEVYGFFNMAIITDDGLCYTTNDAEPFSVPDGYLEKFSQSTGSVSKSYSSRYDALQLNVYTVPVYRDGKITMILSATYSSSAFSNLMNVSSFDGNGGSILLDGTGNMITLTSANAYKQDITHQIYEKYENVLVDDSITQYEMEFSCGGQKYLAYYEKTQVADWYLVTFVPKSYIMRNTNLLLDQMEKATILCNVVVMGFAVFTLYYYIQNQRKIHKAVFYDPITQRFNAEYLKMRFRDKELGDLKHLSLWVMDVNKFKVINMLYGLEKGNAILRQISDIFYDVLPKDNIYHSRSDEFWAIVDYKNLDQLYEKMETFHQAIQKAIKEEKIPQLNISIGACSMSEYEDIQTIYSNALMAKNQIKGQTNCYFNLYEECQSHSFLQRGQIEFAFERALERKEFKVCYQPQYDLATGKIIGSEALVRWIRPNGDVISPANFIPVFEQNGQILRLDEEVLQIVCEDIQEQKKNNIPVVPVSVNLSRLHLNQRDIVQRICDITKQYGVMPSELCLEITESAIIDDTELLNAIVSELKQLGFGVNMDDYGTGMSSLSSLSATPFDVIKIDKSFIDHIGDERMNVVIESTIHMLQALHLGIIAEGVETVDQIEFLKQFNGCVVQGYFFSKPLSKQDYELLLKKVQNNV